MITLSSSLHCKTLVIVLDESSGSLTINFYETLSRLKESILANWWLIAATIHCLAIVWLLTSSSTYPSVAYFTSI